MKLPLGITGFRGRYASLPNCDLQAFRSYAYTVAILLKGELVSTETPAPVANYTAVNFELPDGSVSVLLNRYHPIVTFVEPLTQTGFGNLCFVDNVALAAIFRSFEIYQVLAQASPSAETYQDLAKVEIKQIQHWQPQTVGEIIFNCWD